MAAALMNLAREAPVIAASIWTAGAIFYHGPTYINQVDSWLHQNGTAPICPPDPPITLDDAKKIAENITRPTHPSPPPKISDKEKNVTKNTKTPMHPSSTVSVNSIQRNTETVTSVLSIPTGGSRTNDTTLISLCADPTEIGPVRCTIQRLGFFRPMANFIYSICLKVYYFFRFCAYHDLLRPAVNDYPVWRLVIITTTVFGLAILPCHARRSLRHRWWRVVLVATVIFSGGCFLIMTYEHQAFYRPRNEDRCIVAAGLVIVPFLHWIVPRGAFTYQWNAFCDDILEMWETVQFCAAGIWRFIAYPNRYSAGALGWVLLSAYWKDIIQMIQNPRTAFRAMYTATSISWDSAPAFLEAYNVTKSRRRIFQERTSLYGVPVLRLLLLSMVPSIYYYLLHFAGQKNLYAKSLGYFLPFRAIVIAGWHGFDPLDLASVTVGTLVDATIFYLGKNWTALGHFHLAFSYLYYWLIDLTIVPLLKATGRFLIMIAMGLRKLARRYPFIFRTLCSVFATAVIANVVLFGWFRWTFGRLGTRHYVNTVSAYLKDVTAVHMTILPLTWSWISSTPSLLVQCFISDLSSSQHYLASYNWPRTNASAWILTPNVTHIYDDSYNRTKGSVIYLPSRSLNGLNGVWDCIKLVVGGSFTTILLGSKGLLHSGAKYVNRLYGVVAHPFERMLGWSAESWTQNQETLNTLIRVLFWFGVLYRAWKFKRWIMGNGGGGAVNGGPGLPLRPAQNFPRRPKYPTSAPAGPTIPQPGSQGVPLPPPLTDNVGGDGGNNFQSPTSGGSRDYGNDGGSDGTDSPSTPSPSSGSSDGGDDKVNVPAPSPRSFLPPRIVPPRVPSASFPIFSPTPSPGSSQLPPHSPPVLSSPPDINGFPNSPIVGLTPSEQAAELRRVARTEEDRLAEIERQKGAVLAQLLHEYHLRKDAAATIKQTYRTYKSNRILKLWKKIVVSSISQKSEWVTAAARLEAEKLRKEEEDRAAEARLDSERLRKTEEEYIAEVARLETKRLLQEQEYLAAEAAHLEAERLRKVEEEYIAEVIRFEFERLREEQEYLPAEAAHLEAERLRKAEEEYIAEATHLECERLRKAEEEYIAEAARLEAERLRKELEYRAVEAAHLEDERLGKAEEEYIAEAARLEAERLRKAEETYVAEATRLESERLLQEQEYLAAEAAHLEAERLRIVEENHIAEVIRFESERLREEQEHRAAETVRLEAERLRKAEEEYIVEAARFETERLRQEQDYRAAETVRLEAERLRKAEEEYIVEAARLETERLRQEQEYRAAETVRLEAERLRKAEEEYIVETTRFETERLRQEQEHRAAETVRLEDERLRKAEEEYIVEAARLEAERLRKAEEEYIVKAARLETERLRQEEEDHLETERQRKIEEGRVDAESAELSRVEAAHIERRERSFKQEQDASHELARLDKERKLRLDEVERKHLASEKQARRENERIVAEQPEHIDHLAREREDAAEKMHKERERLQDVEKKRREKLAEIEAQNMANTPKKKDLAAAKEREKARAEWMRKRREEKRAAIAAKEKIGDGTDAQKKREEEEAIQDAQKREEEEAARKKREEEEKAARAACKKREEEDAAQAAQKKREEEEQLRQAKEKGILDNLKQFGKQKTLDNMPSQMQNSSSDGRQVDKARRHADSVARMSASRKGKKKRIRNSQEKYPEAYQQAHEDGGYSNDAPIQTSVDDIVDATITRHTLARADNDESEDSDLSSINSVDSETRREVEINIIRSKRDSQK
jgi:hypothetical protein